MRRTALVLVVLATAVGFAAAGCGGEEEATPTPEPVTGTTETTPTETETTETGTTETETTETTPPEGDAAAGKSIFVANCGVCHTLSDAGSSGTVGPNLDDAMPSFELAVDRVTNGRGAMPSFKDQFSDEQIRDVATYVSQAAGG